MSKIDMAACAKQFEQDGYLLLRNVLSPERVEKLNNAIDEVIAQEPEALAYNLYNSVERHDEIAALMDEPSVLPLVAQLLGHNIQLHISHLTIRKPNPNDLDVATQSFINWHQDGPHPQFPSVGGVTGLYYIKACYILSDMTEPDRGNTKVVPGSHNKPYTPECPDTREKLQGEVQICGKPGDVFIFAQNLWHSAAPNHSEFTRRQLFMGYSPVWMRPIDYHAGSPRLLEQATPIQKQLLGVIDSNPFKYYVPDASMLPLRELLNK